MKKIYEKKWRVFMGIAPGEFAYIIESASVEISKTKASWKRISLGTLFEKDILANWY